MCWQSQYVQDGDLLDGSFVLGASKGDIVGGGLGGVGVGTLLQDLREAYLQDFSGVSGQERDKSASYFDAQLNTFALRVRKLESDTENETDGDPVTIW